jgi:nitrate reductase NapE component
MHNKNDNNFSSMMWMMLICCLVPVVILFFVGGKLSSTSNGYLWPILIVGFMAVHLFFMRKGHGGCGNHQTQENQDSASSLENKSKTSDEEKNSKIGKSGCH